MAIYQKTYQVVTVVYKNGDRESFTNDQGFGQNFVKVEYMDSGVLITTGNTDIFIPRNEISRLECFA
jgi:hypothetical protein